MASVVTSVSDVVNLALQRIGYAGRIGSIYDGSEAAKDALDIYGQTRDDMLREGDGWPFASRSAAGVLLKSAPVGGYFPPNTWTSAYPAQPWRFEYGYPDDCLELRACKPAVYFVPNFSPQPYTFAISNDNGYTPARRVILSNVQDAMLTYTGQVTNPATWPNDFIEAFAAALGQRLAPALMKSLDMAKLEAADSAAETAEAGRKQG
jgi:hypothetical protein